MTKKTMLLALAAVSAAILALPAVASANWGVTPANLSFTGTGGFAAIAASGEPTVACEGPNHSSGSYDGSGTTGSIEFHITACHINIPFIGTLACHTAGAPLNDTVRTSGTFHNVTITNGKRGILVTLATTTVHCNTTEITVGGNIIGEVTEPTASCPVAFNRITMNFTTTNGAQTHRTIDGSSTEYNLTAQTPGGSVVQASETIEETRTASGVIECNTP